MNYKHPLFSPPPFWRVFPHLFPTLAASPVKGAHPSINTHAQTMVNHGGFNQPGKKNFDYKQHK